MSPNQSCCDVPTDIISGVVAFYMGCPTRLNKLIKVKRRVHIVDYTHHPVQPQK